MFLRNRKGEWIERVLCKKFAAVVLSAVLVGVVPSVVFADVDGVSLYIVTGKQIGRAHV